MPLIFEKNNWKQFTIRMHTTDSTAFDTYYEVFWKPFLQEFDHYLSVIEYPNTSEKHLHAVLGTTKGMKTHHTDKILNKIKRKQFHQLNLLNTDPKHAVVVKDMNDPKSLYSGIGYLLKSENPTIISNISKEDQDAAAKAYYHFSKKPHHTLDNVLEYKNVPKGDVLAYLYDHHKKFPDLDIDLLLSHMIQTTKCSFYLHTDNMLKKAVLELKLKIKNEPYHHICYTDAIHDYRPISHESWAEDKDAMMHYPRYLLVNAIQELQHQIKELKDR